VGADCRCCVRFRCIWTCVPHSDVVSCMQRHREAASGSNVLDKAGTVATLDSLESREF